MIRTSRCRSSRLSIPSRVAPLRLTSLSEGDCCVLTALARVVDRLLRFSLPCRHVQDLQHQFTPQVPSHLPADNLPAVGVYDNCQVQIALLSLHVGDVCHPKLIGPGSVKVSVHEVGNGTPCVVSDGRRRPLSATYALWPVSFMSPATRFLPT